MTNRLDGMTWDRWQALSRADRLALRDTSGIHPALKNYVGQRVSVTPKREFGASTFRVGITTGWRPALLAMREHAHGSSDLIGADEQFTVTLLGESRRRR